MIKHDISENLVKPIYLAIGSNLGNRKSNIEKAKIKILENRIKILKSSNFYETLSWPNIKNPKFLNIILEIKTKILPNETGKPTETHFVYPASLKNNARLMAFRNFIFSKVNEWKF